MLKAVENLGLAGVIACMAYWAMVQLLKRLDKAIDQIERVIDKIESGFKTVSENSNARAGEINAKTELSNRAIMDKLNDIHREVKNA